MRKSLSLMIALSVAAANPLSVASAAPVAPAPVAAANDASNLVVEVKRHGGGGKRRGGGGRHHGGGHHRGGGKHHGGNKHHGGGKQHGNKRHGDRHRGDRHHGGKHYKGYGRHHHHHWRWNNGRWVRPADYWWIAGGAIAAGVAIGYLTYADAAAWAYDPPGPGYCWYYTDPSRENGFWDLCPVN